MKFTRLCLVAVVLATVVSCGTPNPNARPAKSPDSVILTEEDVTDRPYVIIQDIDVTVSKATIFNADPTRDDVARELKKKAASMGADAVILVRYGTLGMGLFNWGEMKGRGRAVAFQ